MTDPTLDPARTSWVQSANGHAEFPIQNLPHGVFSPSTGAAHAAGSRSGIPSSISAPGWNAAYLPASPSLPHRPHPAVR